MDQVDDSDAVQTTEYAKWCAEVGEDFAIERLNALLRAYSDGTIYDPTVSL